MPAARRFAKANRIAVPLWVDEGGQTAQAYHAAIFPLRVYFVDIQGKLRFCQNPLRQSEEQALQIVTYLAGGETHETP